MTSLSENLCLLYKYQSQQDLRAPLVDTEELGKGVEVTSASCTTADAGRENNQVPLGVETDMLRPRALK